jgi:hypothetical protein
MLRKHLDCRVATLLAMTAGLMFMTLDMESNKNMREGERLLYE